MTWKTFTAAPHRVMFFGGSIQLLATITLWGFELAARGGMGTPLGSVVSTTAIHAFLMLYALFGFFMFGFLMTTYPRWMARPEIPRRHYLPPFVLQLAGAALLYPGVWSLPLLVAGVVLHLSGWVAALYALWCVYRSARGGRRYYETHLNVALTAGLAGEAAFLLWLLTGEGAWLAFTLTAGLWLFLIPVLAIVAHRMLPFFSSSVISAYRMVQPAWSLPLLWLGVAGHAAADLSGSQEWRWLPDLLLLLFALYHSLRWGLWRSFGDRLLASLHIAFAWFAVGMGLFLLQDGFALAGSPSLGRAPLHALAIGFIASMVLSMATRVSRGHSGRPLTMDRFEWGCFLGIQAAALLRLAAEWERALLPLSALLWLGVVGAWVTRFLPIYLRPRIDGRAG